LPGRKSKPLEYLRVPRTYKASDWEYEIIKKKAREMGMSVSKYLRFRAMGDSYVEESKAVGYTPRPRKPKPIEPKFICQECSKTFSRTNATKRNFTCIAKCGGKITEVIPK